MRGRNAQVVDFAKWKGRPTVDIHQVGSHRGVAFAFLPFVQRAAFLRNWSG